MKKCVYAADTAGAHSDKAKLIASRINTTQSSAWIYDSSMLSLPFQSVLNSRPASLTSLGYLNYPVVQLSAISACLLDISVSQANKNHGFSQKASKGPHSGTECGIIQKQQFKSANSIIGEWRSYGRWQSFSWILQC